jgi:phosphoglycerate dehydrogenase-like enzyme
VDEVLVTWAGYEEADPGTGGRLLAAGLRPRLEPKTGARDAREVARLAAGAVAAIVSTDPFDAGVFAAAPRLRVVARVGVGTDSIDLEAATAAGVVVATTPGANREAAADHAVAMMLAAVRRVTEHDRSVRRGEWERGGPLTPWELNGTTVGIVGFGDIGRAVARRLAGFDVRLLVSDPVLDGRDGRRSVPLAELLERSHVVSLHLPLSLETERILDGPALDMMREDAILVNTSRGPLVDERALISALEAGRLRAAALDVFADEPAVPAALAALPNVVLTPHIGGLSDRSIRAMTEQATQHVLDVLGRAREAAA